MANKDNKIEEKVYDPILSRKFDSRHCKDKKATPIYYDHTGAILTTCDCGVKYWHDMGAYWPKDRKNEVIVFN